MTKAQQTLSMWTKTAAENLKPQVVVMHSKYAYDFPFGAGET